MSQETIFLEYICKMFIKVVEVLSTGEGGAQNRKTGYPVLTWISSFSTEYPVPKPVKNGKTFLKHFLVVFSLKLPKNVQKTL
jgi:hypothetical protein